MLGSPSVRSIQSSHPPWLSPHLCQHLLTKQEAEKGYFCPTGTPLTDSFGAARVPHQHILGEALHASNQIILCSPTPSTGIRYAVQPKATPCLTLPSPVSLPGPFPNKSLAFLNSIMVSFYWRTWTDANTYINQCAVWFIFQGHKTTAETFKWIWTTGENKHIPFRKSDFFLKLKLSHSHFKYSISWPSCYIHCSISLAQSKIVLLILMEKLYWCGATALFNKLGIF